MEKMDVDRFISTLMKCTPLAENEVKFLCDRVCIDVLLITLLSLI